MQRLDNTLCWPRWWRVGVWKQKWPKACRGGLIYAVTLWPSNHTFMNLSRINTFDNLKIYVARLFITGLFVMSKIGNYLSMQLQEIDWHPMVYIPTVGLSAAIQLNKGISINWCGVTSRRYYKKATKCKVAHMVCHLSYKKEGKIRHPYICLSLKEETQEESMKKQQGCFLQGMERGKRLQKRFTVLSP